MSEVPAELKYSESHEWLRLENDGTATIGITEHAQSLLGDLVFVELPECDENVIQSTEVGVVESVKAASDLYTPVSGRVIEVNQELESNPELINRDPYGDGWIFKIELSDTGEVDQLLDADAYGDMTAEDH